MVYASRSPCRSNTAAVAPGAEPTSRARPPAPERPPEPPAGRPDEAAVRADRRGLHARVPEALRERERADLPLPHQPVVTGGEEQRPAAGARAHRQPRRLPPAREQRRELRLAPDVVHARDAVVGRHAATDPSGARASATVCDRCGLASSTWRHGPRRRGRRSAPSARRRGRRSAVARHGGHGDARPRRAAPAGAQDRHAAVGPTVRRAPRRP